MGAALDKRNTEGVGPSQKRGRGGRLGRGGVSCVPVSVSVTRSVTMARNNG